MLVDSVGFCSMLYKPVNAAPTTDTNHPIAAALAHDLHSRPHDFWLLTFTRTLQAACRPEEAQSLADELMQAPSGRPHSKPLGLWIAAQAANLREDVPAVSHCCATSQLSFQAQIRQAVSENWLLQSLSSMRCCCAQGGFFKVSVLGYLNISVLGCLKGSVLDFPAFCESFLVMASSLNTQSRTQCRRTLCTTT